MNDGMDIVVLDNCVMRRHVAEVMLLLTDGAHEITPATEEQITKYLQVQNGSNTNNH